MTSESSLTHALSFDIEDWFHMVEIDAVADPTKWDSFPSLVEEQTRWIVDTLGEANTRATFFMLGWVAERHPQLAPLIAEAGHEVACHSYWHGRVDQQSPAAFREETARTKELLEQQTGRPMRTARMQSAMVLGGYCAMVRRATPFSVRNASSSPVSAISRTMSQPPTNSPFT